MTTTRTYASTDTGAPVLTGEAGTLANVLQKCLVDGYGSKVAAGWSLAFSGANKIALRNSLAAGGTGHYFRILDDASGAEGVRVAWMRGHVDMSDVDTPVGSDVIPNVSSYPDGGHIAKSESADATARTWRVWADELTCWLWVKVGNDNECILAGFGDIDSFFAVDSYRSFVVYQSFPIIGNRLRSYITVTRAGNFNNTNDNSCVIMRDETGSGVGANAGVCMMAPYSPPSIVSPASGGGYAPISEAAAAAMNDDVFAPAYAVHAGVLRGRFRGLNVVMNDVRNKAADYLVTYGGTSMRVVRVSPYTNNSSYQGAMAITEGEAW